MSRLIDADKLIEWINEQREQVTKKQVSGTDGSIFTREALVTMQRCISTFENKINNQPPAFDKEKVVEQLKETRKTALNKVKMPIMIVCKHDLQEFADICFEESIDIVKKGGVE